MKSDVSFDSVTYTKNTVEESVTFKINDQPLPRSTTPMSTITPVDSIQSSGSHSGSPTTHLSADSTPALNAVPYNSYIPHPDELCPPSGVKVQGYYVVTVGQEVGIFFNWLDVKAHVDGIRGAAHIRCEHWPDALALYTKHYYQGLICAVPTVGGPFSSPSPSQMPSSPMLTTSSSGSDELWSYFDDPSQDLSGSQT
ncbi:hypothetical protein BDR03DRAFT_1010179 [Suillus americanus]|nr:hypothetical protein BDR03DRAFT_1010179 [Suillus americanus]